MKLKTKKTRWTWGLITVIKDILGYIKFIKVIKSERQNPSSKFNKYNMKHNMFYVIYTMRSLDESDAVLDERMKRVRLLDTLRPVHTYLDDELGFAGNLTPEFSQFFNNENKPTLTYAAIYRYVFNKLSLFWIVKWSIIIGLILFLSKHIDFIINFIQKYI